MMGRLAGMSSAASCTAVSEKGVKGAHIVAHLLQLQQHAMSCPAQLPVKAAWSCRSVATLPKPVASKVD